MRISLVIRALLLSVLAFSCADLRAAGMRGFENVPLSEVPADIRAGQGDPLLEAGYLDVTKGPYNADPSGLTDTSAAIQAAIDDGYAYNFAVYVPKGTYLLEHPIEMVQQYNYQNLGASNRKFANQLIGDTTGGNFPVLKAKDGSLGSNTLVNIYFNGPQPETRHYNSLIRGFVIDMGNNPSATALSLNGAQYCSIEDIIIRGANFNVGIYNLPGSGGSTTNVKIIGGNTGIWQANYRPTPSVQGVELIDQNSRAIHHTSTRGALILAGFRIEGGGPGYVAINTPVTSGGNPSVNLVLVDGSIELRDGAQVAIDSRESSMYVRNIYVKAPIISRNGVRNWPTEELLGDAESWTRVSEYAFAGAGENSPLVIDGVESGSVDAEHWLGITEVSAPPAGLLQIHAWVPASFPTYFNRAVLDIRDYGATPDINDDDDGPAINQALLDSAAQGKPAFVPRGFFHVMQPIEVPAGASMLGSSYTNSVIMASPDWQPSSHTAIVRTADADGQILLVDIAINGHEGSALQGLETHKNVTLFHGRTSNMLLRDVQINRREYWQNGRSHFEAPAVRFSGNAGGRVYNLALDLHHASTEFMHPDHRMILVDGTHHPLAIYQPDSEGTLNDPQTEIRSASNVTWYGFKYEREDELLRINNSSNIAILGGSGNYDLEDLNDDSIVEVNGSNDIALAILARQGAAGSYAFVREDGVVRVPGSLDLVTLYKKGEPVPFGELVSGTPPPPPDNEPPIAAAGPDQTAEVGALIEFDGSASSDPDGTIVDYSWDFGEGAPTSGVSTSHTYDTPGDYIVTLTVTDDAGETATDTATVTVTESEPPVADAGPDQTAEAGALINFDGSASSDPDGTIVDYSWDFDDNAQASGVSTSHTYDAPGDYIVTLTVTDDAGETATDTATVTITEPSSSNEPPVADAGPDQTAELGASVNFNGSGSSDPDGTIVDYSWDFDDNAQASGLSPSHAYATAGVYVVTLTVTDDAGATDTDTATVTISQPPTPSNEPPVANAGPNQTADVGEPINFDGSASSDPDGNIGGYSWDFDDGSQASGVSASHAYAAPGNYVVTLTVTDDDTDTDTDTAAVTITAPSEPPPPSAEPTLHVADIDLALDYTGGNRCRAIALVTVLDQLGLPVSGVSVQARWTGPFTRNMTRTTNVSGVANVVSPWRRPCPSFTITVLDLVENGYTYEPSQNVETSDTISP